jgi:hypothetical protein
MYLQNKKAFVATVLIGAFGLTYAAGASTFFIPDEDSSSLVQILITSMQQLNTLNQELGTVRQTYSETKKLTGYAEDAANAFVGLTNANFSGAVTLLESAVPNVRFFDREAHHLNSWTQGRGELNALVSACVRARQNQIGAQASANQAQQTWSTTPGSTFPTAATQAAAATTNNADQVCANLDAQISGQRLALLISTDFGPPYTPAQQLADQVAADALGDSEALAIRDQTLQDDWKGYEQYCFQVASGSILADLDDSAMQRCQAAEVMVQIRSAREMQILRGEARELKDIEAYRLLEENGDRKRESDERTKEQQQLIDGSKQMVGPNVRVSSPGYDISSEQ